MSDFNAENIDDYLPPRAPLPLVKSVKYNTIELEWGQYMDRLNEVFTKEDGRISVEVQIKMDEYKDWELLYTGYGRYGANTHLEAETKYNVRMRFRNKHGTGEYSPVMNVTTAKRPLTGDDIHKAIRLEDVVGLRKILSANEANIEVLDDTGFTPLQVASCDGKVAILDVLLEFGASIDTPSDAGKTALMIAAYKEQLSVIQKLIDNGAEIEQTDKNGLTALHVAVDTERVKSVALLLKLNANVDVKGSSLQWTALHRVAGLKNNGNTKVAKVLINFKANVNELDRDGKTPLMLAAMNGHLQLTEMLLESGAKYNLENQMGHTAMRLAETNDRRLVKKAIEDFIEKERLRAAALEKVENMAFKLKLTKWNMVMDSSKIVKLRGKQTSQKQLMP